MRKLFTLLLLIVGASLSAQLGSLPTIDNPQDADRIFSYTRGASQAFRLDSLKSYFNGGVVYFAGFGQSNMDGRSATGDRSTNARILTANADGTRSVTSFATNNPVWQAAKEHVRQNPTDTVVIFKVAEGGTSISEWGQAGTLRDSATTILAAHGNPDLDGIFWMQGEKDRDGDGINTELNGVYADDNYYSYFVDTVYTWMVPLFGKKPPRVVLGETANSPTDTYYRTTRNGAIKALGADTTANIGASKNEELATYDGLHFDGTAVDTLGQRMYDVWTNLPYLRGEERYVVCPENRYELAADYSLTDTVRNLPLGGELETVTLNSENWFQLVTSTSYYTSGAFNSTDRRTVLLNESVYGQAITYRLNLASNTRGGLIFGAQDFANNGDGWLLLHFNTETRLYLVTNGALTLKDSGTTLALNTDHVISVIYEEDRIRVRANGGGSIDYTVPIGERLTGGHTGFSTNYAGQNDGFYVDAVQIVSPGCEGVTKLVNTETVTFEVDRGQIKATANVSGPSFTQYWQTNGNSIKSTVDRISVGTTDDGSTLNLSTAAVAGREAIMKAEIGDSGTGEFGIANATASSGLFLPAFYAYEQSSSSPFNFRALTNSGNAASGTALFTFLASQTDNATDPNSGTFTDVDRDLFRVRTGAFDRFTITGAGRLTGGHTYSLNQVLGAGQDNYVATYDHSLGRVLYQEAAGDGDGIYDGSGSVPDDVTVSSKLYPTGAVDGSQMYFSELLTSQYYTGWNTLNEDGDGFELLTRRNVSGTPQATYLKLADGDDESTFGARTWYYTNLTAGYIRGIDWGRTVPAYRVSASDFLDIPSELPANDGSVFVNDADGSGSFQKLREAHGLAATTIYNNFPAGGWNSENDMDFPAESGTQYGFRLVVYYDTDTGTDAEIRFDSSTGAISGFYTEGDDGLAQSFVDNTALLLSESTAVRRRTFEGTFTVSVTGAVDCEIRGVSGSFDLKAGTEIEIFKIN